MNGINILRKENTSLSGSGSTLRRHEGKLTAVAGGGTVLSLGCGCCSTTAITDGLCWCRLLAELDDGAGAEAVASSRWLLNGGDERRSLEVRDTAASTARNGDRCRREEVGARWRYGGAMQGSDSYLNWGKLCGLVR